MKQNDEALLHLNFICWALLRIKASMVASMGLERTYCGARY